MLLPETAGNNITNVFSEKGIKQYIERIRDNRVPLDAVYSFHMSMQIYSLWYTFFLIFCSFLHSKVFLKKKTKPTNFLLYTLQLTSSVQQEICAVKQGAHISKLHSFIFSAGRHFSSLTGLCSKAEVIPARLMLPYIHS